MTNIHAENPKEGSRSSDIPSLTLHSGIDLLRCLDTHEVNKLHELLLSSVGLHLHGG